MPLQDEDFDEVRRAVEPGLTASQLPDTTINSMVFAGRAELQMLRLDPLANGRTDPDEAFKVRLARILLTAANLIERIPFKRRERNGPYEYVNQGIDPETAAATLRSQGYAILALIPGVILPQWTSSTVLVGGRGNVQETWPLGTDAANRLGIGRP